ncbi:MAG: ABC transporter ATP-binding protein [Pseudomonadota bacterium]
MNSESTKLHLEDVYKTYGEKLVLDNIDLKVTAGELCTVVGPSGCGKSTLLRLLLGQEAADSGSILIDGKPVSHPDPVRGIVYQKYSLFPHLSVFDNVMLGLRFASSPWWLPWRDSPEHTAFAMHMLEKLRLVDARSKFPHELSGGMQQRVAIAQALVKRPPILLMDEPFGALDPDTREQMQLYLMELHEELALTIFFVTHDLEEACFIGSRLLMISQYYADDRELNVGVKRGAKIVADHLLQRQPLASTVKDTHVFREFITELRQTGFNPANKQHVKEFNLLHPNSFQTLTSAEHS